MMGCHGECVEEFDFDIVMAFQPVVDIAVRRIYGYEALVRGANGEGAAQVLARVTADNLYAFDQQCRVTAIETAAALGLDRRLSINFLPNAVHHPEACLKLTLEAAARHRFPASLITFEFTENEKIFDRKKLKAIIETYNRHGFMTALDDFGAGYSGLALLAEYQPDMIKIDRLLVRGIEASRPKQTIAAALLTMAGALGLSVVAEGVGDEGGNDDARRHGRAPVPGLLFRSPGHWNAGSRPRDRLALRGRAMRVFNRNC